MTDFFHVLAKRKIGKNFLALQQEDRTVNAYAAEFVRLNCFAPALVV